MHERHKGGERDGCTIGAIKAAEASVALARMVRKACATQAAIIDAECDRAIEAALVGVACTHTRTDVARTEGRAIARAELICNG